MEESASSTVEFGEEGEENEKVEDGEWRKDDEKLRLTFTVLPPAPKRANEAMNDMTEEEKSKSAKSSNPPAREDSHCVPPSRPADIK